MAEKTYKIIRGFFRNDVDSRVIATGLTLEEAREHCRDPETSSKTATSTEAEQLTRECGPWFDGYEEE